MKKKITFLLLTIILLSCSKNQDNFSKYEWNLHYKEYNEDYSKSTSQKRVLFRNDSIVCWSDLTGKTELFPLIKKDSLIIFKELYTIARKGERKRDTIVTDTLLYDFKKLFNEPLLIIKPLKSDYYNILTTTKNNVEIEETNNFLSIINFKIGGYQIGDSISFENLNNINDADNFVVENLLVANPKNNENVELEIIDKKYIYRIRQKNIERKQTENIVKVINEKINITPDIIKETKPFYTNGFKWNKSGVDITLINKNMYQYYIDIANDTKGEDIISVSRQTAALNLAGKNYEKSKYFELECNNIIIQEILETLSLGEAQSSIIE